jgi:hypothetical protein
MDDGLPAPDEERQSAPQDHRGGESELNPGPCLCKEKVLHGHGRWKRGDHQRQDGRRQRDADPQTPCHVHQLWIGFLGCSFDRFERHAAFRAAPRSSLLNLWMHGAGVSPMRRVFLRSGAELSGAALTEEMEDDARRLLQLSRDRPSFRIRDRVLRQAPCCDCRLVSAHRSGLFCSLNERITNGCLT